MLPPGISARLPAASGLKPSRRLARETGAAAKRPSRLKRIVMRDRAAKLLAASSAAWLASIAALEAAEAEATVAQARCDEMAAPVATAGEVSSPAPVAASGDAATSDVPAAAGGDASPAAGDCCPANGEVHATAAAEAGKDVSDGVPAAGRGGGAPPDAEAVASAQAALAAALQRLDAAQRFAANCLTAHQQAVALHSRVCSAPAAAAEQATGTTADDAGEGFARFVSGIGGATPAGSLFALPGAGLHLGGGGASSSSKPLSSASLSAARRPQPAAKSSSSSSAMRGTGDANMKGHARRVATMLGLQTALPDSGNQPLGGNTSTAHGSGDTHSGSNSEDGSDSDASSDLGTGLGGFQDVLSKWAFAAGAMPIRPKPRLGDGTPAAPATEALPPASGANAAAPPTELPTGTDDSGQFSAARAPSAAAAAPASTASGLPPAQPAASSAPPPPLGRWQVCCVPRGAGTAAGTAASDGDSASSDDDDSNALPGWTDTLASWATSLPKLNLFEVEI